MKKIFLILFVCVLGACTFQVKHRGYVFPADLDNVVADIKTTAQLQDEIGSPQVKTIYGDEVWIYYGADVPEEYQSEVLNAYLKKIADMAATEAGEESTDAETTET